MSLNAHNREAVPLRLRDYGLFWIDFCPASAEAKANALDVWAAARGTVRAGAAPEDLIRV